MIANGEAAMMVQEGVWALEPIKGDQSVHQPRHDGASGF